MSMDKYLQGLFILANDPAAEVRKLVSCWWNGASITTVSLLKSLLLWVTLYTICPLALRTCMVLCSINCSLRWHVWYLCCIFSKKCIGVLGCRNSFYNFMIRIMGCCWFYLCGFYSSLSSVLFAGLGKGLVVGARRWYWNYHMVYMLDSWEVVHH